MLHVALYQPEIPPNTGNIMRLCVNVGAKLHLIEPLGFQLTDKQLRRAGLDYREFASVQLYPSLEQCITQLNPLRVFGLSTKGTRLYHCVNYQPGDLLLFGPETRGLPDDIRDSLPKEQLLTIPMQHNSRSLNLSNAVAIVLYEAWRQLDFFDTSPMR